MCRLYKKQSSLQSSHSTTYNKLEDEITERMSTQVHELTQASITSTLPTTTEILSTTEPSTPTTISIIDATLAVDQVEFSENNFSLTLRTLAY